MIGEAERNSRCPELKCVEDRTRMSAGRQPYLFAAHTEMASAGTRVWVELAQ